jgi:hypothetical protein
VGLRLPRILDLGFIYSTTNLELTPARSVEKLPDHCVEAMKRGMNK